MPRFFCFFLLSVFFVAIVPTAVYADAYGAPSMKNAPPQPYAPQPASEDYGNRVATKLGAGLSNMLLGFLEIPKNVVNTSNEVNLALGVTGGVAKGILHSTGRILCGIVDFISFPAPTQPIITPQYVWNNFSEETRYFPVFKVKK